MDAFIIGLLGLSDYSRIDRKDQAQAIHNPLRLLKIVVDITGLESAFQLSKALVYLVVSQWKDKIYLGGMPPDHTHLLDHGQRKLIVTYRKHRVLTVKITSNIVLSIH